MDDNKAISLHLYQYLCKLFGSPEVVRLRRKIYTAVEFFSNGDDFQIIPSGSRCEGLEIEGSDFDIMFLWKFVTVYENLSNDCYINDTVAVIMDYSDTNLGFTRLQLPNIHSYNVSNRVINTHQRLLKKSFSLNDTNYISSLWVRNDGYQDGYIPHGPCQIIVKNKNIEAESLFCFRCRQWISLASPWQTRIRRSWPSQNLIDDITHYGVLFVPVGSKTSTYEQIEWRISFSIAEKQLIHSFSHIQLLCYAMLKVVVSDIIKKHHGELLCSYFVKTIMFWMSEENDSNYWFLANLVNCFMACFHRLIYCVEYRDCRHYFIPEINFFEDRFNDTEHRSLLSSLYHVYNMGWTTLLYTNTFKNFQSLQSRRPHFTSSVVAPIRCISSFGYNSDLRRCLENIIRHAGISSKYTKCVMFYVLATFCQTKIKYNHKYNHISHNKDNKSLYKQYKHLLPTLVLGTRTDCVSGWCHLASLFYKLKLYRVCKYIVDDCLTKFTQDKIYLARGDHIEIPVHIQNIVCNLQWFPAALRYCFIDCVSIVSLSLVPEELAFIYDNDQGFLSIPPLVFLFFLKFICAYHLKQKRDMKIAFRGLQRTAKEKLFIFNDYQILTTAKIISVDELFIVNDDLLLTAGKIVELADRLLHEMQ